MHNINAPANGPMKPTRLMKEIRSALTCATGAAVISACGPPELSDSDEVVPQQSSGAIEFTAASDTSGYAAILVREIARIDAEAARIDSIFQPLSLLRPAQEETLRRFGNAAQLARARALGIDRLLPPDRLEALQQSGVLSQLEDSDYWIVRDLDYSQPLAIPAVHDLLTEIGRRFHARLDALGAPGFRLEVSSVLRTAENQAALRRTNPNAAIGESTHEYGTTVDVLYSAFAGADRPDRQA